MSHSGLFSKEVFCRTCKQCPCCCEVRRNHAADCMFRRAVECPVAIECEHGADVCPICDPCTCGKGVVSGDIVGDQEETMPQADGETSREEMLAAIQRAIAGSIPYVVNHNAFLITAASWSELANIADPRHRRLDQLMERSARGEKITEAEVAAVFADVQQTLEAGES